MCGNQYTHPLRGRTACIDGRSHGGRVADHLDRDESGYGLLQSDQFDISGFRHGIRRFDSCNEAACFYQTECVMLCSRHVLSLGKRTTIELYLNSTAFFDS